MKGSFGLTLLVALLTALVFQLLAQLLPYPALSNVIPMGLPTPVTIDLGILSLVFGVSLRLSVAGAMGLAVGLIYMLRR